MHVTYTTLKALHYIKSPPKEDEIIISDLMYKINRSTDVHTTILNSCAYLQLQTFPAACFPWKCWMFWTSTKYVIKCTNLQTYDCKFWWRQWGEYKKVCYIWYLHKSFYARQVSLKALLPRCSPLFPVKLIPASRTVKNPLAKQNRELNFSINCLYLF